MNREQIREVIRSLAKSQGLYGRLDNYLDDLQQGYPDEYNTLMLKMEKENFKDAVDLVLYVEG